MVEMRGKGKKKNLMRKKKRLKNGLFFIFCSPLSLAIRRKR